MQTADQKAARPKTYMTIEEYLTYDDGTDIRYELVDGELVEMPLESQLNATIARFLLFELARHIATERLMFKDTEIEVSGRRAKCRVPDLMVHSEESLIALQGANQAVILRDMPPPDLIIEVVSPGRESRDRDYRYKRTEYAARGVAEYWIVDPELQQVTVCQWVNGQYEDKAYSGDAVIHSAVVASFNLSAAKVLLVE